jgi:uncharacterized membrane-anchored protein
MSRRWITGGLLITLLLQLGVLAVEYLVSVYPLWTGQEVRLETVPVDPRSLFRGNYVLLDYEISRIDLPEAAEAEGLRWNEVVYVKLKQGENNLHVFDGASLTRPETGLYIRGRLQSPLADRTAQTYPIRYGIEALFAPAEKALALEEELRDGGIAVVMLADNGKAALKDVVAEVNE